MKRRNLLLGLVSAVVAPIVPAAPVASITSSNLLPQEIDICAYKQHKKFVNNSRYGKLGRGMTSPIIMIDESPFMP